MLDQDPHCGYAVAHEQEEPAQDAQSHAIGKTSQGRDDPDADTGGSEGGPGSCSERRGVGSVYLASAIGPTDSGAPTRGQDGSALMAKNNAGPAYIKDINGVAHAVYPTIRKQKRADSGHPEERVRMDAYNKLMSKYGYPAHRIDIEVPVKIRDDEQPRFADIVAYDDDNKKRPLVVVECKKPNRKDGERQGQRYATILRAVYVLWTNGASSSASVLVNRYPEEAVKLDDIPPFKGEPKYEVTELRPFDDDAELTATIRKCHSLIRNLSKKKPDAAFDEFLKFLFVKFMDERRESGYEVQVFLRGKPPIPEEAHETGQRIRALFHLAARDDAEISSVFSEYDDIELSNDCLSQLTRILQPFSFSSTTVDLKARAFETFLSRDMRQEFKEFMTPRGVVEAVVEMAQPTGTDVILDPCCGTAAFLIYSLAHVRASLSKKKLADNQRVRQVFDFAHDHLWGFDASSQMANVARLNMIVNEDGRAHVFNHDSLYPLDEAPQMVRGRQFDLIMTNPPFGTRVTGPASILKTFGLAEIRESSAHGGGFLTEVLFLERNVEWLKPGGRMFIVLPDSVLGNRTLRREREFIEQRARLVGIISLSADTFGPSGAKSKTSVVILERRHDQVSSPDDDEDVFLADVKQVGYDFTGRKTASSSQLPGVVADFIAWENGDATSSATTRIVKRDALGDTWLAQTHFSRAIAKSTALAKITISKGGSRSSRNHWELGEIAESIGAGKTAARSEYASTGVHIVKVGNLTGRGIQWGCVERQYVSDEWSNRYDQYELAHGDVLFTAAAHGPKWIGLKVDIFDRIPPEFGKKSMFCAEIMRVHLPRDGEVDPYYLLLFLRSGAGYAEIQRCIRGQSGHIYKEEVSAMRLPKPDPENKTQIAEDIKRLKDSLKLQEQSLVLQQLAEVRAAKLFPSTVVRPIIAR